MIVEQYRQCRASWQASSARASLIKSRGEILQCDAASWYVCFHHSPYISFFAPFASLSLCVVLVQYYRSDNYDRRGYTPPPAPRFNAPKNQRISPKTKQPTSAIDFYRFVFTVEATSFHLTYPFVFPYSAVSLCSMRSY